ncbi:DUF1003 domain-containing protein [Paenibacillus chitinolyticus]|uniref:DUF1003 domain-containing protein n=1 Tax=Paenibacillus chitinolyticus TaxID=79263 RepID=UPI0036702F90
MSSKSETERTSEERLLKELEKYPRQKLHKEDVERVTEMVRDYQGKIKAHLHEQQEKKTNRWDRMADHVAVLAGSWWFVTSSAVIITVWMLVNSERNSLFILSFSLSILSLFQSTLIQKSQNRQAAKDKQEQMLDIAINYKAEQENLEIQQNLKELEVKLQWIELRLSARSRAKSRPGRTKAPCIRRK